MMIKRLLRKIFNKSQPDLLRFIAVLYDPTDKDPWQYPIFDSNIDLPGRTFSIEHKGSKMTFFIDYRTIKDLKAYYKIEKPVPIKKEEALDNK